MKKYEKDKTMKYDGRITVFMRKGGKEKLREQVQQLHEEGYTNASMSNIIVTIYADWLKNHTNEDLQELLIKNNMI